MIKHANKHIVHFLFCLLLTGIQPLAIAETSVMQNYEVKMKSDVLEKFNPPANVKRRAMVNYVVRRDGSITDARIVDSSGNADFDKAAMDAITRSNPFPYLPAEYQQDFFAAYIVFSTVPSNAGSMFNADPEMPIYIEIISDRILDRWIQPSGAKGLLVKITFDILSDGQVSDVRVTKTSGNDGLDQSVLTAVLRSNPLPPLPKGYPGNSFKMILGFVPAKK